MGLPFTADQFFGVFAEYNRAFWPVAVALWLVSGIALVAAWRHPRQNGRRLSFVLGGLWIWTAIAYHALLFTRINPAAWLFSGLFAIQAALCFHAGARQHVEYFAPDGPARGLGLALACYALAYPLLNLFGGHQYPATPTFGVPCPTAIFTISALLGVRGGIPVGLAIIPAAWGLIGGSAAVLLAVAADYVLLGAGVLLTVTLIVRAGRRVAAQ